MNVETVNNWRFCICERGSLCARSNVELNVYLSCEEITFKYISENALLHSGIVRK